MQKAIAGLYRQLSNRRRKGGWLAWQIWIFVRSVPKQLLINFISDTLDFHNYYKIINTAIGKGDKLHDVFELHYIELRKFIKPYREITTALDRWSTFLTKAHQLDKQDVPEQMRGDPAIVKAITAVDRMFDEDDRIIYQMRMEALADIRSKIASAEEKGRQKGRELRKQGIEKAQSEVVQATAQNLLRQGLDHETIARVTRLTVDAIASLNAKGG
ncbi:Rpn family recombination-promoting nuclease/putative transposase [Methylicorpusculum sp.]|uniref:Rpn family recombination-promoting nuclease/putative transposase n=1 Tax=Methylicorpusculum sp. TaxID=2713644 RepID=UPI002731EEAC|nr:Rpn family recombination-promoting nuclease/putative transposase [Methylicorpusculum sp.]MDP2179637.1 Rpn family recombination-promoting nuclease/putative transposase [Methylicorpusculum sp.]MDP3528912.1 Rpn family recombination-promoting nuclease/putative transposase [Methylicorpusculum sp.]MDZ4153839.1 Rpn family recombination-promoting nuclease/putative transposase [Methylicorpusculum sp.]